VLRFEQDDNPKSPVIGSQRVSEAPTGEFFNRQGHYRPKTPLDRSLSRNQAHDAPYPPLA
ncbi:MAG: hypothetical protein K0S14_2983, partial [Thermomicrobiales bacterium]|nr:hypothetical protein [Thermomicrobiales bacterium]